jgi:hypothetical protein
MEALRLSLHGEAMFKRDIKPTSLANGTKPIGKSSRGKVVYT